jgi:hypothetical protein
MKVKDHMTISINAEEAFNKVQYSFMVKKKTNKLGTEGT